MRNVKRNGSRLILIRWHDLLNYGCLWSSFNARAHVLTFRCVLLSLIGLLSYRRVRYSLSRTVALRFGICIWLSNINQILNLVSAFVNYFIQGPFISWLVRSSLLESSDPKVPVLLAPGSLATRC